MKTEISATLRDILVDTQKEIAQDKDRQDLARLKAMLRDAVPVRSFASALSGGSAVIAELKEASPSQGRMRAQNVAEALAAYKESPVVKAVSVLTSWTHFGANMRVEKLAAVKDQTGKPGLRKDFMIEEYQVYQARAYGADAILIMANILQADEMRRLSELAFELGMDVLFETHCAEELAALPETAKIIGINSRSFEGGLGLSNFKVSRFLRQTLGSRRDTSVDLDRFGYIEKLPRHTIKIAESGISAENCREVFSRGFDAILVGTSLLMDPRGVRVALREFESAITPANHPAT